MTDTPTNPAAVVEQVEKLALALLNDHRNCYGCWGCRPILEAALHEAILLGIEQGRAEMWESEPNWDGLPRQIMMWLDMDNKTPRALFKHLERTGHEIPQWLRDEPEMQHLDHVPSKGTRCVILWKAMAIPTAKERGE